MLSPTHAEPSVLAILSGIPETDGVSQLEKKLPGSDPFEENNVIFRFFFYPFVVVVEPPLDGFFMI